MELLYGWIIWKLKVALVCANNNTEIIIQVALVYVQLILNQNLTLMYVQLILNKTWH